MALIVKAILNNLRLMQGLKPDTTAKRGSLLFTHLMPKMLASHRASRIVSDSSLAKSLDKLRTAQKEEGRVFNETLRLAAQRDGVSRKMAEGWEKRKTEASLDVEVRKYLKQHKVLEAQVDYAAVELNRGSLS